MSKKNFMEKPVTVSEAEVVIDKSSAVCLGRWYTPLYYAPGEVKHDNEAYEELYRGKDGQYFVYGNHGIVTPEIEGCAAVRPEGVDREEIKPISYCDAVPNICEGFTGLDEETVAVFLKNIWHLAANTGATL